MDDSQIVDFYLARNEEAIVQTSDKYGLRLRPCANFSVKIFIMSLPWHCLNPAFFIYLYLFLE